MEYPEDQITHYSCAEGWFYILDDGTEVGPFKSEWEMFKYCEDRDLSQEAAELQKPTGK